MSKYISRHGHGDAIYDAKDTVLNFLDEIVQQLIDDKEVSNDLNNDYPDGDAYHHETHVDKSYSLQEAADLLNTFSDFEETDGGLWDGLGPREAISVQAAYTYGNAVYYYWTKVVEAINDGSNLPMLDDALEDLREGSADVTGETIKEMVKQIIEEF